MSTWLLLTTLATGVVGENVIRPKVLPLNIAYKKCMELLDASEAKKKQFQVGLADMIEAGNHHHWKQQWLVNLEDAKIRIWTRHRDRLRDMGLKVYKVVGAINELNRENKAHTIGVVKEVAEGKSDRRMDRGSVGAFVDDLSGLWGKRLKGESVGVDAQLGLADAAVAAAAENKLKNKKAKMDEKRVRDDAMKHAELDLDGDAELRDAYHAIVAFDFDSLPPEIRASQAEIDVARQGNQPIARYTYIYDRTPKPPRQVVQQVQEEDEEELQ